MFGKHARFVRVFDFMFVPSLSWQIIGSDRILYSLFYIVVLNAPR